MNEKTTRPWFNAAVQKRHQLLVIQKPIYNKITHFIYYLREYSLLYKVNKTIRVYFIISKLLAPGNWAYKLYNAYIADVTIRLKGVSVTVINIYNPIGNKKVIIIKKSMKSALNKVEKEIILFKNFNAHHPMWGSRAAVIKTQSEYLLRKTKRRTLYLLTPQGEVIWQQSTQKSIINLIFIIIGVED